ncbi:MAG: DciA family protein [Enhygromyxa sp.]
MGAPSQLRRRRRRAKPKRRGRIELATVVEEVLQRHVPEEVQRLSRVRNSWIELFPTSFADHVWPMLVQGGRLVVHVHDSQWLHEMTYWRQEVLSRLRDTEPPLGIEIIEAYTGPLPPLSERRPPPPPEVPPVHHEPVLDPEIPSETLDALKAIQDPKLREALAQARWMMGRPR